MFCSFKVERTILCQICFVLGDFIDYIQNANLNQIRSVADAIWFTLIHKSMTLFRSECQS